MNSSTYRTLGAVLGVAAGVVAIAMGFYVHRVSGYRLGLAWHLGVVVSAPRLLVAMGVVMIIGGLLTLRFVVLGGILTALPLVLGLAFAYQHVWYRMANLHVWAASVVLALLSCVCAGLALQQEIVPVGAEPTGPTPVSPPPAPLVSPPPAPLDSPPPPPYLPPPPLDEPGAGVGVTPPE